MKGQCEERIQTWSFEKMLRFKRGLLDFSRCRTLNPTVPIE